MNPITPCLWFEAQADEAVDFYVSVFPNSRRVTDAKYGPDAPGEEGTTMVVQFELAGSPFMAVNGGPMFQFTPAVSFVVNCTSQADLDHYWESLLAGGSAMQCGWLTDRFGVSWQIVPERLGELMSELDPERGRRVMQAMLQMVKLDIAGLEAAAAD
jgi:predicted 3-demethylubiquinone-9 3-methyltransferase (glyoxalase superfamily)